MNDQMVLNIFVLLGLLGLSYVVFRLTSNMVKINRSFNKILKNIKDQDQLFPNTLEKDVELDFDHNATKETATQLVENIRNAYPLSEDNFIWNDESTSLKTVTTKNLDDLLNPKSIPKKSKFLKSVTIKKESEEKDLSQV